MLKTDLNHDQYYCQNPSNDQKNKRIKINLNENKKAQVSQKLKKPEYDNFNEDIFKNIKKTVTVNNSQNLKESVISNNSQAKDQLKNSIELIFTQNILQNFKLQKQTYQRKIQTNSKGKLNLKKLLKHQSCNLNTLKKTKYPDNNYEELGQYFCDSIKFKKNIFIQKNSKSNSKSSRSKKSRGSITSPLRSIRKSNKFDQIRSPISKVCQVIKKQQKQIRKKKFLTKKNSLEQQITQSKSLDKLNQIFRKRQLFTPSNKLKTLKDVSVFQIQQNYYNGPLKRQININENQEKKRKKFIKNQIQHNKYFLQKYVFRNEPQTNKNILMKQKVKEIQPINYLSKNKYSQENNQYQQFDLVHNLLSNPKLSEIPSNFTESDRKTLQFSHKHPQLKKSVSCQFDYSDYGIQNQQSQLLSQQQLKNTLQSLQYNKIQCNNNQKVSQYIQNQKIQQKITKLKRSKISIGKILSPKKSLSISGSNKSLRISSKKKKQLINSENNVINSQRFNQQVIKSIQKSSQSSFKNIQSSQLIDQFQDYSSLMSQKKIKNRLSQKNINEKKSQLNYFQGQYALSLKNIQQNEKNTNSHVKQVKNNLKQSKTMIKKQIVSDKTQKKNQKSSIVRIISLKNIQKDNINKLNKNKQSSRSKIKKSQIQNQNQSSLQHRLSKNHVQYSSYEKNYDNNKSKITLGIKSSQRISQDSSNINKQSVYTSELSLLRQQIKKQRTKSFIKSTQNNINTVPNTINISICNKIAQLSNTVIKSDSRQSLQTNAITNSSNSLQKQATSFNSKPQFLISLNTPISFKKKKPSIEYTLNQTCRLIEQHQQRIQLLCLYIDNCKNFYQEDYDMQKYQLLCFLMLKKNIYQIERVIKALLLQQYNVFNLTNVQIDDIVLEKYVYTQEIGNQLSNLYKQSIQRKKQFQQTYYSFQKKYQNQKGFNLNIQKDDFSSQIVNKLIQQLNILYEKWEKNKSDGDRITALKICKKYQKRMIQIIQLIFLISQLDGKKIKACQLFIEKQEDFKTYYEKHFQKIIQTIEYFDSKKRDFN